MIRRAALILVFLSLAWTTAPQLWRLARQATSLAPHSRAERRARVNGKLVAGVERVKRELPPNEPVALLGDPGFIIFANYYGYPWLSRDVVTLDNYRAAAGQPRRPNTIVVVGDDGARIVTYGALRDERLRRGRVMHEAKLQPAPRSFFLPLVSSVDGLAPDTYVTETAFANDGASPARVTVTLHPDEKVHTLTVPPRGGVQFHDLLYQLFGINEVRWASIGSDQPLRAGAWFVNRGRNEASALPLQTLWRTDNPVCPTPATDCKLWIVNRYDHGIGLTVDGRVVALPPHGMTSLPFRGTAHVVSHDDSFAFATTKGPPTQFIWPEGAQP
jgi:hypothetical protein